MVLGNAASGQHSCTLNEENSRAIIKHALECGINFFDTAIVYQQGNIEQFVGRALKDFAKRDEVFIATKFLPRSPEEVEKNISGQKHVTESLNQSLKNLGADYVNLHLSYLQNAFKKILMQNLNTMLLPQDSKIIERVIELYEKYGVSITEISLAQLLTKVESPVVGAMQIHHIDGAAKAIDLKLFDEDINYLEELYTPHKLVGVMAQNKPTANKNSQVLIQNAPKI